MARVAMLLVGLLCGCASNNGRPWSSWRLSRHHSVQAKPQPSRGDFRATPVVVGGLDEAERSLQTRYSEALEAGAARHESPEDPRFDDVRKGVASAWAELRDYYRLRLLEDLEAERLAAFRLRLQELLPYARRHLQEVRADALGVRGLRLEVNDVGAPYSLIRDRLHSYRASSQLPDGRWVSGLTGPDGVLARSSGEELFLLDERFNELSPALEAVMFDLDESGSPRLDKAFLSEVCHLRRRVQLAADDRRRIARARLATGELHDARADSAADEAEAHRDRALDAALDARIAAERASPEREARPLRRREVR